MRIVFSLMSAGLLLIPLVSKAQRKTPPAPVVTTPVVAPPVEIIPPYVLKERLDPSPGKAIIPYAKYELSNGLTVIVHEDNSSPVVHVEVTYKVGSNRELPGRSGFAHFFEHMMFQGSEHVADEEHFKIIQEAGGNMNGTTNRDRTNYFQTVPSNMLETVLWLEADRMGFLPNAFTDKKFEVQRATVKNEKSQNYDVPYGFVQEVKDQLLYPLEHPYSWPIIGFTDDLDNATRNDLNAFFLRYYGPNNAVIVVSGDVKETEVMNLVAKYFGSIPKGPEVKRLTPNRVRLPESDFKTYKDNIYFPLTLFVYPTVQTYHRDEAPLDVLAQLISGGKSSILYENFVKAEKAVQVNVFNPTFELAGEFTIQVVSYPGTETKDTRDLIIQTLNDFNTKGFSEADLEKVKESIISGMYGGLESNAGKAAQLTSYELLMSGKNFNLEQDIDRYRKVTKKDVERVFREYILNKNYACITVERDPYFDQPNAKKRPFESFNPFSGFKPDYSEFENLKYNRPVDTFDRSIRPTPPPARVVKTPELYKFDLPNGVRVMGTQSAKTPRVFFSISIDGGQLFEDGKKVPFGTAFFTAAMMNESTKKYPSAELEAALDRIGSSISFSGSGSSINGSVSCYKDKVKETMELLEEMLLNANFEREDFNLTRKLLLESIANQRFNDNVVASKAFSRLIYGENNPLGKIETGNYNEFAKVKLEDVARFYQNFLSPQFTKVIIVGDLNKEESQKALEFMSRWEKKNAQLPTFTNFPQFQTTQVFLINKDFASQSNIMIGNRAMPFDTYGDFYKAGIVNFVLGGNFNSRLNLTIREEKGWTYGIRSGFSPAPLNYPGFFMVNASVKASATDSAIAEVFAIMKAYRENGITEEELAFTKSALVSSDALRYESVYGKAGFLNALLSRNLEADYRAKQAEILQKMTREEVNAYIKQYLQPDNMVIVVVGTQSVLRPQLEALGFGKVQVLDKNAQGKIKIYKKK